MKKQLIGILLPLFATAGFAGTHQLIVNYKTDDFLTVILQLKNIGPRILSATSPTYTASVGDKYNFGVQPTDRTGAVASGNVAFDATDNDFKVSTGGVPVCYELKYTDTEGNKQDRNICSPSTGATDIPGLGENSPLTVTVYKK